MDPSDAISSIASTCSRSRSRRCAIASKTSLHWPGISLHSTRPGLGRPLPAIPDAAIAVLQEWSWPGNVRELQNVIERAVIVSGASLVLPLQDIQPKARLSVVKAKPLPMPTFQDAERETILRALRESGGVIAGPAGAAARLGLQRTTLQSKMRKLGIRRPSF